MKLSIFISIWLSCLIFGSLFVVTIPWNLEDPALAPHALVEKEKSHFSVVWKGFAPDYSNQTPDYYVCINNLKDTSLQMQVALKIENLENNSYYFKIDQYAPPPSGWTILTTNIGLVTMDQTRDVLYTGLTRTKPSTIPDGRMTESVELDVQAYYDAAYMSLYSRANFTVRFHFLNLTSPAWTVLDSDNFDSGSAEDWTGSQLQQYTNWRSYPYSLYASTGVFRKVFNTGGPYSEVYLIFAMRPTSPHAYYVQIDSTRYFETDTYLVGGKWYQIAIPLPLSSSFTLQIGATTHYTTAWLDDVYLIAK